MEGRCAFFGPSDPSAVPFASGAATVPWTLASGGASSEPLIPQPASGKASKTKDTAHFP